MPTDKPWYTIVAATVLALGFAAAAFWLLAFTDVETGTAFAFLTPALLIVGFITGQSVPSAVTSVLSRASVASPSDQAVSVSPAKGLNEGTVRSVREVDAGYLTAVRWDDGTLGEYLYPTQQPEGARVSR